MKLHSSEKPKRGRFNSIATTHIRRQLISDENSYQFEKTTHIGFANMLQILKFNHECNL